VPVHRQAAARQAQVTAAGAARRPQTRHVHRPRAAWRLQPSRGMDGQANVGWLLVALGLVLAGVGLAWVLAPAVPWLGRLPGDIRIERDNVRFYFPVVT